MSFDVEAIRRDFPILTRKAGGHSLVYLDSANTSQKLRVVVDAITEYYFQHNANVARVMHVLGTETTETYEGARDLVASFIGTAAPGEMIFTRNASEALSLAADTLATRLIPGDKVMISVVGHHSNTVPWRLVCERTGAALHQFGVTGEGRLDLEAAERDGLISERTRMVSVAHVSNALGTHDPVAEITAEARAVGAAMVVDASQPTPHQSIDVTGLGADLVAFAEHKMYGLTDIGVLWGGGELLESLPPFLDGREMIGVVEVAHSTYVNPPYRSKVGTPPIAQAAGLSTAIRYLQGIGMGAIAVHEHELAEYMLAKLISIDGLLLLRSVEAMERGSACSFNLEGIHPYDAIQVLDSRGIAIRGGHHCARPLHRRLGHQSSARASAHLHTAREEINVLADALVFTRDHFGTR